MKIRIINKDDIKPSHRSEHQPYEYYKYQISGRGEGQCTVALYELPPGKANYPYHYHMGSEEIFYIISGCGRLETPEGDKPIKAGDVVVCPAGLQGAHRLVNTSRERLVYLDCDTVSDPEVVFYPRSDKVGIMTGGEARFYQDGEDVEYYEGE